MIKREKRGDVFARGAVEWVLFEAEGKKRPPARKEKKANRHPQERKKKLKGKAERGAAQRDFCRGGKKKGGGRSITRRGGGKEGA